MPNRQYHDFKPAILYPSKYAILTGPENYEAWYRDVRAFLVDIGQESVLLVVNIHDPARGEKRHVFFEWGDDESRRIASTAILLSVADDLKRCLDPKSVDPSYILDWMKANFAPKDSKGE